MSFSIANRIRTVYRTLAMKIVFLALVFLLIPLILYRLFESADAQQSQLLQRTVEEKGTLIASVLQPRLAVAPGLRHGRRASVTSGRGTGHRPDQQSSCYVTARAARFCALAMPRQRLIAFSRDRDAWRRDR